MTKIMVIGGAGFIGHHLVNHLQNADHDVAVLDCMTNYFGTCSRSEHDAIIRERTGRFRTFPLKIDLMDYAATQACVRTKAPEVIVHLAAPPQAKIVGDHMVWATTAMMSGLVNALEAAKAAGARRFVFVSSSMVYGNFEDGVTEDAPLLPFGTYAVLKVAGETLVRDYCDRNGIEWTIVRPSAVYGPGDVETRVMAKMLISAALHRDINVNGASEKIDLTYVGDLAKGLAAAALHPNAAGQIFNITAGKGITLYDAAMRATELTTNCVKIVMQGKDANFPSRGALSITKAKELLGWEPTVDFALGSMLYWQWLKTSPYLNV